MDDEPEDVRHLTQNAWGKATHWSILTVCALLLAAVLLVPLFAPPQLETATRIAFGVALIGLLVQAVSLAASFQPAPAPLGTLLARFRRRRAPSDDAETGGTPTATTASPEEAPL